jgi:hypothetical protein
VDEDQSSTGRPAGPILDELGVTLDLADDDRITEVLVIAKSTNLANGDVALTISVNDLDWIAQLGLLSAASQIVTQAAD